MLREIRGPFTRDGFTHERNHILGNFAVAIAASALGLIGSTPLIALDRIHPGPGRILAKAEFLQPGGSVKDRAAFAIIRAARDDGRLKPGAPVVEMTSGNMGSGLAIVCATLNHPLVLTISAGNSPQRVRMMEALRADVVIVPQVEGCPGEVTGADIAAASVCARQLADERDGFYVDQFHAPEGLRAHEAGTGPEIWEQANGRIDGWVAAVGTGATFMGVAAALRRCNSAVVCAAVEPEGCEPLSGKTTTKARHLLQGTGYGYLPPLWQPSLMDMAVAVSDAEATMWKSRLAREEGLHVGYSSAANVCAANKLLKSGRLDSDGVVATILCDTGLKY